MNMKKDPVILIGPWKKLSVSHCWSSPKFEHWSWLGAEQATGQCNSQYKDDIKPV